MTAEGSDIYIYGDTTFTNNLVGDSGGENKAPDLGLTIRLLHADPKRVR